MDFLLDRLQARGALRRRLVAPQQGFVDFASNDYLGLAKRAHAPLQGSTGSRLLTGNQKKFEEVEERIAHYFGAESALIYSAGYTANLGLISCVAQEGDAIFFDTEAHASIHDGIALSKAAAYPFRHNDLAHLEERLKISAHQRFVLVESLYSISGDFAPLVELHALCERYGAHLIVDEAHTSGLYDCPIQPFARMIGFGKAFGFHGAAIVGSALLKEYLINFSRSLIYSTAPSFFHVIGDLLTIDLAPLRAQLFSLCRSPIIPIYVDDPRALSAELAREGFDIRPILSPTTRKPCLRLVVHAFNTPEQIQSLKTCLQKLWSPALAQMSERLL